MLTCREGCGRKYTGRSENVRSFVCANCTQDLVNGLSEVMGSVEAQPMRVAQKKEVREVKGKPGFTIGWHRKKHFVHPNGDIYERGILVTQE